MITAVDRFSALSIRQGMTLGALHASSRNDFALVLAAAAAAFAPGRTYTEREVNDLLLDWLARVGTMLEVDHVELRRWLVDNCLLDRDGYGRAYCAGRPAPEFAACLAEFSGIDLAQVTQAARTRDAKIREERKRKWAEGKRTAAGTA